MRLLITLVLGTVAWLAQRVALPGIEGWKLELLGKMSTRGSVDLSTMSVVAMGLSPALTGFVLVELTALVVPRWRALRVDPGGRVLLRRWAILATVVSAAIQGWFIAAFIHQRLPFLPDEYLVFDPGLASRLVMTTTLVGGTCFLLGIAWLINRHGLGNGFSILLVAPAIPTAIEYAKEMMRAVDLGDLDPPGLVMMLATMVVTVLATRWILKVRGDDGARQPTSGVVPITIAASLLMLPAQLANFGIGAGLADVVQPGSRAHSIANLVLVAALGPFFSRLFQPGANFRRTIGFLIGMTVIPMALVRAKVPFRVDVLLIITATAVVMDLIAEWRARKLHGELIAIVELHQMPRVTAAVAALDKAKLPHYARAAYHRALLHFFGPYLPVEILVPAARADEARSMLSLGR